MGELGILLPSTGWGVAAPGHRHPVDAVAGRLPPANSVGGYADFLDEISASPFDVILTTELMWSFIGYPSGFANMQKSIEQIGLDIEYLIYFRAQSQLISSLYSELSKYDYTRDFNQYFQQILDWGSYNRESGGYLNFDYSRWIDDFKCVTGREINAFSYHVYAGGDSLIRHFFEFCFPDRHLPVGFFVGANWTNHRLGAHAVQARIALNELRRRGERIDQVEAEILRRALERDRGRTFEALTDVQNHSLAAKFEASNLRLLETQNIDLFNVSVPEGLVWREICGASEFQIDAVHAARKDIDELIGQVRWPSSPQG